MGHLEETLDGLAELARQDVKYIAKPAPQDMKYIAKPAPQDAKYICFSVVIHIRQSNTPQNFTEHNNFEYCDLFRLSETINQMDL